MSNHNRYENAPIILSILQLRFAPTQSFDIKKIKSVASMLKKKYPKVEERYSQGILIDNNDNETNVSLDERKFEGVQIMSEDKQRLFVITADKFTFQSKNKYLGWDDFTKDIMEFWNEISETLGIKKLNGISLRYVNKFELPLDLKDFKKYFTTYLEDKKNDFKVTNYQFRFSSFDKEKNLSTNIGHSLEKPTSDYVPYIFDIDVLKNESIENDKNLWQEFDNLRKEKNKVFDNSITEETIKLIK